MFNLFKRKKNPKAVVEEPEPVDLEPISLKSEEQPKKDKREPVKRYEFYVKGTHIEERQKILKKVFNELKKEEYFDDDKYEGLTNKEIKEDYFEERIFEYEAYTFPKGELEDEDDNQFDKNAIKVLVTNFNDDKLHVGYVPKKLCLEIREMKEKYPYHISSDLEGGKYKIAVFDDYGDEEVITDFADYRINVHLSFWEELPDSLKE